MGDFQQRVHKWILACFGSEICGDKQERNHRFLEEALELVQSTGCTKSEAMQLVDYVYGRDIGDPLQEVGGVMNTLAALCTAHDMDMAECGEIELARVWTKVEKIRAKQAAKPKHSPLPMHTRTTPTVQEAAKVVIEAWKNSNPPYYVIDIPLTATGDGPATVGCDADTITYEVWNAATLSTVSKFDKPSDANRACMERNLRALSEEPQ